MLNESRTCCEWSSPHAIFRPISNLICLIIIIIIFVIIVNARIFWSFCPSLL